MAKVRYSDVKRIVLAAFPEYRGRKCGVDPIRESGVRMTGTYWSDGYRDTYAAVNLETLQSITLPNFAPPEFGGPSIVPVITREHLGPNGAVVVHCQAGSRQYVRILAQPHNLPKLLAASV